MLLRGYRGAGLADILKSAQVPKGSFYHYFESKEAFAAEAIEHYLAPFVQRLSARLKEPGMSGIEAIAAYFRDLCEELATNDFQGGCLLGNLMAEIGDSSPAARTALNNAVERYRDLLGSGLARGQAEGCARRDRDATVMADLLIDGWQGALLRMKISRSLAPLENFINEILLGYFGVADAPPPRAH
jgi:TetR/AcrR family transcriptional repressor of nem operon